MKLSKKFFFGFFLVLAIYLACAAETGAVFLQVYNGDGAVNNPAVPPGGWLTNAAFGFSCFACHVEGNIVGAPDMTSYLMTGHKNVLRMPLFGSALSGPDGNAYVTDQSGNIFTWADSTISIAGFCTNPAFTDAASCTGGGGIWISGSKDLYYTVGGWMGGAATLQTLFDGSYVQGTQKTAVSYSCARCHTTGFSMDSSIQPPVFQVEYCNLPAYTTKTTCQGAGGTWHIDGASCRAPEFWYTGITWTPANTTGTVNFDPDGNGPAVASSWAVSCNTGESLEGVECERCHDASTHSISSPATVSRGTNATALCLQCHRQEHILAYTSGGVGANIKPTPFSDNYPALPASEPVYPLPSIEAGGSSGYARQFYGYSTGMEFLNSAHAEFTGNFQQIGSAAQYQSAFQEIRFSCSNPLHVSQSTCVNSSGTWSQSTIQGGCTTCHDVHQSLVIAGTRPIRTECQDCHTGSQAQDGSGEAPLIKVCAIQHPTQKGSPFDTTLYDNACVVCHMATQAVENGDQIPMAAHLWRINSSQNYSTFPTMAQFYGGSCSVHSGSLVMNNYFVKVYTSDTSSTNCTSATPTAGIWTPTTQKKLATAAADGDYANAVWLDVDLACGQCHGGSGGSGAIHNQAPYMDKAALASYAAGMHNGVCNEPVTPPTPSISGSTIGVDSNWTATATDTSTPGSAPIKTVSMAWGDGAVTTQNAGTTFTHTYLKAGSYTVVQTVTGADGGQASAQYFVTVMNPVITGHVYRSNGNTAVSGALVYVTRTSNGMTNTYLAVTKTDGSFAFATNIGPGTYTQLRASKAGYTFPAPTNTIDTNGGDNIIKAVTP